MRSRSPSARSVRATRCRARFDQRRDGMVAFADDATIAQRAMQPAAQQAARPSA
jgi:hypothetical protein